MEKTIDLNTGRLIDESLSCDEIREKAESLLDYLDPAPGRLLTGLNLLPKPLARQQADKAAIEVSEALLGLIVEDGDRRWTTEWLIEWFGFESAGCSLTRVIAKIETDCIDSGSYWCTVYYVRATPGVWRFWLKTETIAPPGQHSEVEYQLPSQIETKQQVYDLMHILGVQPNR